MRPPRAGRKYARAVFELADVRAHRRPARMRATGSLEDLPPAGGPVHRILPSEERAILELIEEWLGRSLAP